jgi:hypothetical protein
LRFGLRLLTTMAKKEKQSDIWKGTDGEALSSESNIRNFLLAFDHRMVGTAIRLQHAHKRSSPAGSSRSI